MNARTISSRDPLAPRYSIRYWVVTHLNYLAP
jgi:hypothetical protein